MGGVLSSSKKKEDDGLTRNPSKKLNISKADVFAGLTEGRRGLSLPPLESGEDDDGPPGLEDDGPPGLDDEELTPRTPGRLVKQGTVGFFGGLSLKVARGSILSLPHCPRAPREALEPPPPS
jgi:hypothetical protein